VRWRRARDRSHLLGIANRHRDAWWPWLMTQAVIGATVAAYAAVLGSRGHYLSWVAVVVTLTTSVVAAGFVVATARRRFRARTRLEPLDALSADMIWARARTQQQRGLHGASLRVALIALISCFACAVIVEILWRMVLATDLAGWAWVPRVVAGVAGMVLGGSFLLGAENMLSDLRARHTAALLTEAEQRSAALRASTDVGDDVADDGSLC
jgi:hypothetical protein